MLKLLIAALLFLAPAARADQFAGFAPFAARGSLAPFARDMGGLLGSATYHGGRSLGFSGFDVGARYGLQQSPDKNDAILRSRNVKSFSLPWVQAEVGMPFRLDGVVRGISYEGLTVVGGGLRCGILNVSDKPWAPQMLISGMAHAVVHNNFSITHQSGALVYSMGVPQFTPYIGGGFDRTVLLVRQSNADPTLAGLEVTTIESRFTAGMQIRPWPVESKYHFFYINLAYSLLHGRSAGEGGMGIRF